MTLNKCTILAVCILGVSILGSSFVPAVAVPSLSNHWPLILSSLSLSTHHELMLPLDYYCPIHTHITSGHPTHITIALFILILLLPYSYSYYYCPIHTHISNGSFQLMGAG